MITCILRFLVFYKTDLLSDPTWFCVEMVIWTTTETGIYLIAACLPSLRSLVPLVVKKNEKYFGPVWGKVAELYGFIVSKVSFPRRTRTMKREVRGGHEITGDEERGEEGKEQEEIVRRRRGEERDDEQLSSWAMATLTMMSTTPATTTTTPTTTGTSRSDHHYGEA